MGRQVTIKDIAKIAGVSPAVVSLVANGKNGVSKETKDRVLGLIENLIIDQIRSQKAFQNKRQKRLD